MRGDPGLHCASFSALRGPSHLQVSQEDGETWPLHRYDLFFFVAAPARCHNPYIRASMPSFVALRHPERNALKIQRFKRSNAPDRNAGGERPRSPGCMRQRDFGLLRRPHQMLQRRRALRGLHLTVTVLPHELLVKTPQELPDRVDRRILRGVGRYLLYARLNKGGGYRRAL